MLLKDEDVRMFSGNIVFFKFVWMLINIYYWLCIGMYILKWYFFVILLSF